MRGMARPSTLYNSIFWTVVLLIFAFLVFITKEIIGELAGTILVSWVARVLGKQPSEVSAALVTHGAGFLAAVLLLLAFYHVAKWHLQQTVFVDDPSQPPSTLRQMSATEIAEYLRDKTVWAWGNYAKYNSWFFVTSFVPHEMDRAGAVGQIRFLGVFQNSTRTEDLDPSLWRIAGIDEDRIWDSRNRTSIVSKPGKFGPTNRISNRTHS
jgi:hypothetical protein